MRHPPLLAPANAPGFTHIWDGGKEQLRVSDDTVAALVMLGIVYYSPEDGPNARVYRPSKNWVTGYIWTLERIRDEVLRKEVPDVADEHGTRSQTAA